MVFTPTHEIWDEVAATRDSSAYRRNILNARECKITAFHRSIQAALDLAGGRS